MTDGNSSGTLCSFLSFTVFVVINYNQHSRNIFDVLNFISLTTKINQSLFFVLFVLCFWLNISKCYF